MPTKTAENFSPLKYIYNFLPSSDDKALKQAFYNTLSFVFVTIISLACVAVYFILEAFIRPLIWALLIGSCLHPIKRKLTSVLKEWLSTNQLSNRPLFVEAAISPIIAIHSLLDIVYMKILRYIKIVISAIILVPSVYIFLSIVPIKTLFELLITLWVWLSRFLSFFSATWILLGIILYVSLVIFYWTPESRAMLKLLSLPVWVGIVFYLSSITGIFAVPLFILFCSLVCLGCAVEIQDSFVSQPVFDWFCLWRQLRGSAASSSASSTAGAAAATAAVILDAADCRSEAVDDDDDDADNEISDHVDFSSTEAAAARTSASTSESAAAFKEAEKAEAADTLPPSSLPPSQQQPQQQPPIRRRNVASSAGDGGGRRASTGGKQRRQRRSKYFFVLLLWGHGLAYAWTHPWILSLLPFVVVFLALRSLGDSIGGSHTVMQWADSGYRRLTELVDQRRDALIPFPVRGIYKLLLRGDRKLSDMLANSIDAIVSILVILLVLGASLFLAVFLTIQVQRESIELVTMTSQMLNNTVITASNSLLPGSDNLQKLLDSMMGNAYVLGREWISKKINTLFETNDYNKAKIEEQVLQLWDRLYEKLASKNFTNWSPMWSVSGRSAGSNNSTSDDPDQQQQQQQQQKPFKLSRQNSGIFSSSVWELTTSLLDANKIMHFVRENLGTLTSVLESLWIVFKGNMSLLVTLLTTVLSILFGGGTAVLNFLLQSLIFLTSLYLLLCFSGDLYLPVQFVSSISSSRPHPVISALYSAVDDATSGVFLASMKMSCFYGLYTSLTHTVFAVNLVFAPSVLAAIFGAVPFLGTYWASLPGALELWLIHSQPALAILFVLLHLLPSYLVDPTIYSEIKGAGHPYLTGLSVAGGLYWCGLEGAIFGPILLACLLAAVNVYSIVLTPAADPAAKVTRSSESTSGIRRTQSLFDHNKT